MTLKFEELRVLQSAETVADGIWGQVVQWTRSCDGTQSRVMFSVDKWPGLRTLLGQISNTKYPIN